jgi:alginate O-acetyltransferase complex protein AlgI
VASLLGFGATTPASDAVAAVMYTPYHGIVFLVAAALTWGAPGSWAFSRRLTWARAGYAAALLLVSVAFMWTQSENPFIYFQF